MRNTAMTMPSRGKQMTRSMQTKTRIARQRLKDVDVEAVHKLIAYISEDRFNRETARDLSVYCQLPISSTFTHKALCGDYTAAIKMCRQIFPDAEWSMDNDGADMGLDGFEAGYEDRNSCVAMVKCVLDAVVHFAGGG